MWPQWAMIGSMLRASYSYNEKTSAFDRTLVPQKKLTNQKRLAAEVSYWIDRQIEEDRKRLRNKCNILLLGESESGKSTLLKQLKIMHQIGHTAQELETYRLTIYQNLVESANAIVRALQAFGIQLVNPVNQNSIKLLREYRSSFDEQTQITSELANAIYDLWCDPCMPVLMDRVLNYDFPLMLNAPYFFNEARRIGSPAYIPSDSDILHSQFHTHGIQEYSFNMGDLPIHVLDVGSLRGERKKWIHYFEHMTCIIFVSAMSEYYQVMLCGEFGWRVNRVKESLCLFSSVVNSRWFLRTTIVLFLNKFDLFKANLSRRPLERFYPEYNGGSDANTAAKFILLKFCQENRARRSIYPYLTQATDSNNIRIVMTQLSDTVLRSALADSRII